MAHTLGCASRPGIVRPPGPRCRCDLACLSRLAEERIPQKICPRRMRTDQGENKLRASLSRLSRRLAEEGALCVVVSPKVCDVEWKIGVLWETVGKTTARRHLQAAMVCHADAVATGERGRANDRRYVRTSTSQQNIARCFVPRSSIGPVDECVGSLHVFPTPWKR